MISNIRLLDVVALCDEWPEQGLRRGQVVTVVDVLASGVFELEFSDDNGCTLALLAVPAERLMVLHYDLADTA